MHFKEPSETEILIEELISREEAAAAMSIVSSKREDRGLGEMPDKELWERLGKGPRPYSHCHAKRQTDILSGWVGKFYPS